VLEVGRRRKEEGGKIAGMRRREWEGEIRCRMSVRVRVRGGIYMRRSDKREEGQLRWNSAGCVRGTTSQDE
jgi:hypothetical protein